MNRYQTHEISDTRHTNQVRLIDVIVQIRMPLTTLFYYALLPWYSCSCVRAQYPRVTHSECCIVCHTCRLPIGFARCYYPCDWSARIGPISHRNSPLGRKWAETNVLVALLESSCRRFGGLIECEACCDSHWIHDAYNDAYFSVDL